jgi:hypothetical protein
MAKQETKGKTFDTARQSRNQKKHLPRRHGDTERTKSKSKPQHSAAEPQHLPRRHGDTERTKSKSKPQPRGHRESKRALRSGKEKFDSKGKQRNSSRPEKNLIDSSTEDTEKLKRALRSGKGKSDSKGKQRNSSQPREEFDQ